MAQRLGTVMALIEEITFKRIDIRLIRFLLEHTSERQPILYETHEEVAMELGTAREVISRLLKNMEGDHLLMLSRGKIEVTNRQELEKMLLHR
jgi:CRP/FNR family transcriptional regulator